MNKKGFTIIEVLFYIAISTMLILGLTSFMISIGEVRERSRIIDEVEQQGDRMMEIMIKAIRNADSVSTPSIGNSGNSLTLAMFDSGENPTTFNLSGNILQVAKSNNLPQAMHNDLIAVSDLNFYNLSRSTSLENVKVSFTLRYNSASTRQIYDYEKTFTSSASLR